MKKTPFLLLFMGIFFLTACTSTEQEGERGPLPKILPAPAPDMSNGLTKACKPFFDALIAEDIEQISALSSKNALKSYMQIPVDHFYSFKIVETDNDWLTGQVSVLINDSVPAEVFLRKKLKGWKVMSMKGRHPYPGMEF